MSPLAAGRAHVAFVEFGSDGIAAGRAGSLNLPDDRQNIGRELPHIDLPAVVPRFATSGGL